MICWVVGAVPQWYAGGADAVVEVVLVRIQRSAAHGQRHRRGHGEVVAASIAEHLHGGVAEHVPTDADARRPLWLGQAQERRASGVVVGELVVAQAKVQ